MLEHILCNSLIVYDECDVHQVRELRIIMEARQQGAPVQLLVPLII